MRFFFDFVNNWEAVGSNKGLGLQAGVRLGQAKVRGDWSRGYALYEYLQQDAVISAFTWSDFGLGGTNEKGPVIGLDYHAEPAHPECARVLHELHQPAVGGEPGNLELHKQPDPDAPPARSHREVLTIRSGSDTMSIDDTRGRQRARRPAREDEAGTTHGRPSQSDS